MSAFIIWLMVSGLVMIALYAVYSLLLSGQRQPAFNRTVLVLIYVFSFSSLFLFSLFEPGYDADGSIRVVGISSFSTSGLRSAGMWLKALLAIYLVGATVMFMRRLWGQICLMKIIARGEKIFRDGYTIVVSDDRSMATFSWWKYIVMNRSDFEEGADMVIAHEQSHLAARHWIDLLVADFALIVQWFNPASWLMRDELKDIHEFQADERVVALGYDRQAYQLMLIGKAVGRRVSFVGNSLNHGKLKRRLAMMTAAHSRLTVRSRALLMLPVMALLAVGVNSVYGKEVFGMIDRVVEFSDAKTVIVGLDEPDSPIYIVDGEEIESSAINTVDPSAIKSITVRKDQSPNGTIYIKTK